MSSLPLALLPVPRQRFLVITPTGFQPLSGGRLEFYVAGTTTPKAVFSDSDGQVALGVTVPIDSDGYTPAIFLQHLGHKVVLIDAQNAQVWSQDNVENVAEAFLATAANTQSQGAKDVHDGYTASAADNLITVSEPTVNPTKIYLQRAADRGTSLIVKNKVPLQVAIYPYGSETIEGLAAPFMVPAASSPIFPTVHLMSDGISNYWVVSSHGF